MSESTHTKEGLAYLWDYVREHENARPSRSYRTTSGFGLGEWITRRRKARGRNLRLDLLLESLPGWTWTPYDHAFAEKLDRFKKVMATGHLPRDQQSRKWIQAQRHAARRGKLSPEQLALLRAAGVFDLQVHDDRTKNVCISCSEE